MKGWHRFEPGDIKIISKREQQSRYIDIKDMVEGHLDLITERKNKSNGEDFIVTRARNQLKVQLGKAETTM